MPSSIPASAMSDPARAAAPRGSGFWADTLHRVVRNRAAVAGGTVVVLFIAVALFAPVLSPYDPLKGRLGERLRDRKSTRLNSSHSQISYAVFCLKKKKNERIHHRLRSLGK